MKSGVISSDLPSTFVTVSKRTFLGGFYNFIKYKQEYIKLQNAAYFIIQIKFGYSIIVAKNRRAKCEDKALEDRLHIQRQ